MDKFFALLGKRLPLPLATRVTKYVSFELEGYCSLPSGSYLGGEGDAWRQQPLSGNPLSVAVPGFNTSLLSSSTSAEARNLLEFVSESSLLSSGGARHGGVDVAGLAEHGFDPRGFYLLCWKEKTSATPKFKIPLADARLVNNITEQGPCVYIIASNGEYEFQCSEARICNLWLDTLQQLGCRLLKFTDLYRLTDFIGEGSFAKVYIGVHLFTGEKVVVKAVNKKKVLESNVYTEIEVLRKVLHPYIIRLYAAYEQEDYVCLVLEYLRGGELFDYLSEKGPFTEDQARHSMRRLLLALQCLHAKGVVHRDLKTENLILETADNPTTLKLIDFGLASTLGSPSMRMRCGSPGYVAPEILQDLPYGTKVDVFSAGIILYTLIAGFTPFRGANVKEILKKNLRCQLNFTHARWTNVTHSLKDLVAWMCCRNAEKRCAAAQALTHPWFHKIQKPLPSSASTACSSSAVHQQASPPPTPISAAPSERTSVSTAVESTPQSERPAESAMSLAQRRSAKAGDATCGLASPWRDHEAHGGASPQEKRTELAAPTRDARGERPLAKPAVCEAGLADQSRRRLSDNLTEKRRQSRGGERSGKTREAGTAATPYTVKAEGATSACGNEYRQRRGSHRSRVDSQEESEHQMDGADAMQDLRRRGGEPQPGTQRQGTVRATAEQTAPRGAPTPETVVTRDVEQGPDEIYSSLEQLPSSVENHSPHREPAHAMSGRRPEQATSSRRSDADQTAPEGRGPCPESIASARQPPSHDDPPPVQLPQSADSFSFPSPSTPGEPLVPSESGSASASASAASPDSPASPASASSPSASVPGAASFSAARQHEENLFSSQDEGGSRRHSEASRRTVENAQGEVDDSSSRLARAGGTSAASAATAELPAVATLVAPGFDTGAVEAAPLVSPVWSYRYEDAESRSADRKREESGREEGGRTLACSPAMSVHQLKEPDGKKKRRNGEDGRVDSRSASNHTREDGGSDGKRESSPSFHATTPQQDAQRAASAEARSHFPSSLSASSSPQHAVTPHREEAGGAQALNGPRAEAGMPPLPAPPAGFPSIREGDVFGQADQSFVLPYAAAANLSPAAQGLALREQDSREAKREGGSPALGSLCDCRGAASESGMRDEAGAWLPLSRHAELFLPSSAAPSECQMHDGCAFEHLPSLLPSTLLPSFLLAPPPEGTSARRATAFAESSQTDAPPLPYRKGASVDAGVQRRSAREEEEYRREEMIYNLLQQHAFYRQSSVDSGRATGAEGAESGGASGMPGAISADQQERKHLWLQQLLRTPEGAARFQRFLLERLQLERAGDHTQPLASSPLPAPSSQARDAFGFSFAGAEHSAGERRRSGGRARSGEGEEAAGDRPAEGDHKPSDGRAKVFASSATGQMFHPSSSPPVSSAHGQLPAPRSEYATADSRGAQGEPQGNAHAENNAARAPAAQATLSGAGPAQGERLLPPTLPGSGGWTAEAKASASALRSPQHARDGTKTSQLGVPFGSVGIVSLEGSCLPATKDRSPPGSPSTRASADMHSPDQSPHAAPPPAPQPGEKEAEGAAPSDESVGRQELRHAGGQGAPPKQMSSVVGDSSFLAACATGVIKDSRKPKRSARENSGKSHRTGSPGDDHQRKLAGDSRSCLSSPSPRPRPPLPPPSPLAHADFLKATASRGRGHEAEPAKSPPETPGRPATRSPPLTAAVPGAPQPSPSTMDRCAESGCPGGSAAQVAHRAAGNAGTPRRGWSPKTLWQMGRRSRARSADSDSSRRERSATPGRPPGAEHLAVEAEDAVAREGIETLPIATREGRAGARSAQQAHRGGDGVQPLPDDARETPARRGERGGAPDSGDGRVTSVFMRAAEAGTSRSDHDSHAAERERENETTGGAACQGRQGWDRFSEEESVKPLLAFSRQSSRAAASAGVTNPASRAPLPQWHHHYLVASAMSPSLAKRAAVAQGSAGADTPALTGLPEAAVVAGGASPPAQEAAAAPSARSGQEDRAQAGEVSERRRDSGSTKAAGADSARASFASASTVLDRQQHEEKRASSRSLRWRLRRRTGASSQASCRGGSLPRSGSYRRTGKEVPTGVTDGESCVEADDRRCSCISSQRSSVSSATALSPRRKRSTAAFLWSNLRGSSGTSNRTPGEDGEEDGSTSPGGRRQRRSAGFKWRFSFSSTWSTSSVAGGPNTRSEGSTASLAKVPPLPSPCSCASAYSAWGPSERDEVASLRLAQRSARERKTCGSKRAADDTAKRHGFLSELRRLSHRSREEKPAVREKSGESVRPGAWSCTQELSGSERPRTDDTGRQARGGDVEGCQTAHWYPKKSSDISVASALTLGGGAEAAAPDSRPSAQGRAEADTKDDSLSQSAAASVTAAEGHAAPISPSHAQASRPRKSQAPALEAPTSRSGSRLGECFVTPQAAASHAPSRRASIRTTYSHSSSNASADAPRRDSGSSWYPSSGHRSQAGSPPARTRSSGSHLHHGNTFPSRIGEFLASSSLLSRLASAVGARDWIAGKRRHHEGDDLAEASSKGGKKEDRKAEKRKKARDQEQTSHIHAAERSASNASHLSSSSSSRRARGSVEGRRASGAGERRDSAAQAAESRLSKTVPEPQTATQWEDWYDGEEFFQEAQDIWAQADEAKPGMSREAKGELGAVSEEETGKSGGEHGWEGDRRRSSFSPYKDLKPQPFPDSAIVAHRRSTAATTDLCSSSSWSSTDFPMPHGAGGAKRERDAAFLSSASSSFSSSAAAPSSAPVAPHALRSAGKESLRRSLASAARAGKVLAGNESCDRRQRTDEEGRTISRGKRTVARVSSLEREVEGHRGVRPQLVEERLHGAARVSFSEDPLGARERAKQRRRRRTRSPQSLAYHVSGCGASSRRTEKNTGNRERQDGRRKARREHARGGR
ncbi:hypothetical protein BESB_055820 [Besnoitia besnoiti]|uniref:Protein kinase domain-containing protein n=1 Tax=Besnoitia besnoiti TaxID=94643 RepID=A0A2A9MI51_BESBE|nr:hypothetical protein BESB_055820 [Besnoitia besnoiti]PFH35931.1 hypothetical protein BESB_055820 [Besnoitia besnoiti]